MKALIAVAAVACTILVVAFNRDDPAAYLWIVAAVIIVVGVRHRRRERDRTADDASTHY